MGDGREERRAGGRHRGAGFALAAVLAGCAQEPGPERAGDPGMNDPWLWLEDVDGDRALDWIRAQNTACLAELQSRPDFEPTRARLRAILDSKERIPYVGKRGAFFYNFWRDAKNPRGLWRRTTLDEFRRAGPAWETVIDLDALAAAEKENWVWHGAHWLEPSFDRCFVELSRGGKDASVWREFDPVRKEFVKGGFELPESKGYLEWRDRDTVYVGTDFGPGSLTTSGYTRIAKEWKRGTPLPEARVVFEGTEADVSAGVSVDHNHGRVWEFARRSPTFFTTEHHLRVGDAFVKLELPPEMELNRFGDWLLLQPRVAWTLEGKTWPAGSLLAANVDAWLKGDRAVEEVFVPSGRTSLRGVGATRNFVILNLLDNVRSRPCFARREGGRWVRTPLAVPEFGIADVWGVDPDGSDDFFLQFADFLTPTTLSIGTVGNPGLEKLKSLPSFFDAAGLEIVQNEAVSRDGTHVPYFLVSRKGLVLDGTNPTLLHGYGGFEVSMLPNYGAMLGAAWLEKGGVYALANIRGGGEFGPDWHNAARKASRQRAYDDFAAVAEDLIARKVTSPRHLGISGRSNGGLLMGVMLTQRPELFRAVSCGNPLLDMRRYNVLLAGASWMDEYGDPDKPEEWAWISKFSPYQNLRPGARYPRVLFTTSTRDDRVHPGHARKMFARMQEQGHDALYYENIEGGHGSAANNEQAAFMEALAYAFLWKELK